MRERSGKIRVELLVYAVLTGIVFILSGALELFERLVSEVHRLEAYEADEIITTIPFVLLFLAVFSFRRWRESVRLSRELEAANARLLQALDEIRELKGIIPICAECKKIRDDEGYWQQLEEYISTHSGAVFSHGLCPDCFEKAVKQLEEKETEEASSSA